MVDYVLQNKDEGPLSLFYSLLNQNSPQGTVVIQALLNPGNYPRLVFVQISHSIFNSSTSFEIDPLKALKRITGW